MEGRLLPSERDAAPESNCCHGAVLGLAGDDTYMVTAENTKRGFSQNPRLNLEEKK